MYRDGFLTYDSDAFDSAIVESKKVTEKYSSIKDKAFKIRSLVPNGFTGSSNLNGILFKLTSYDLDKVEKVLIDCQKELNQYVKDNALSAEVMEAGYKIVEINGIRGYLYIPEGYTSTAGLPLVTWLAGSGEIREYQMNQKGLSRKLNEGYEIDAVVWCPIDHWAYARHQDTGELCNSITGIMDKYKLDKDRNALIGYSVGSRVAYWCVEENPNFFSTVVSFGDIGKNGSDSIKSTDTTFIIYQADRDHPSEVASTYKNLKQNGNQVVYYELDNSGHGDVDLIFTDKLMLDIINIKRGDKFSNITGEIINVDTKYESGGRTLVNENHYIPLKKVEHNTIGDSNNDNLDVPEFELKEEENTTSNPDTSTGSESGSGSNAGSSTGSGSGSGSNTGSSTGSGSGSGSNTGSSTGSGSGLGSNTGSSTGSGSGSGSNIESMSINILPENKFSDIVPEMKYGNLDSMEISKSMVNYSVSNISESNYNDYVNLLENSGFTYLDGKWIKDNYELVISYNDNNLTINLVLK